MNEKAAYSQKLSKLLFPPTSEGQDVFHRINNSRLLVFNKLHAYLRPPKSKAPPSLLMFNILLCQSDFEDLDPAESEKCRQGGPSILFHVPNIETL